MDKINHIKAEHKNTNIDHFLEHDTVSLYFGDISRFLMYSCDSCTHIIQGCFTGPRMTL